MHQQEKRAYPTVEGLLGQPESALLGVKTSDEGWAFIESVNKGGKDQPLLERLCRVVFRQLVVHTLREKGEHLFAKYLEDQNLKHEELYAVVQNAVQHVGSLEMEAATTIYFTELLETFSPEGIQRKLLKLTAVTPPRAKKPRRSSRQPETVRPGRNRTISAAQRS